MGLSSGWNTKRLVEIGDPAGQMAVDTGGATEGVDRKNMEGPVPSAHGDPPAVCRKTDMMDGAGRPASPEIVAPGKGAQGEYPGDVRVVGDRQEGTAVAGEREIGDGLGMASGKVGQAEGCGVVQQGSEVEDRDGVRGGGEAGGDALGNEGLVRRLEQRRRLERGGAAGEQTAGERKDRVGQRKRPHALQRSAAQHMQPTRRRLHLPVSQVMVPRSTHNDSNPPAHRHPASSTRKPHPLLQHTHTGRAHRVHQQRRRQQHPDARPAHHPRTDHAVLALHGQQLPQRPQHTRVPHLDGPCAHDHQHPPAVDLIPVGPAHGYLGHVLSYRF